jgi:hypothetical protein
MKQGRNAYGIFVGKPEAKKQRRGWPVLLNLIAKKPGREVHNGLVCVRIGTIHVLLRA